MLLCGTDFHHSFFQVTYLFFCLNYSAIDDNQQQFCSTAVGGIFDRYFCCYLGKKYSDMQKIHHGQSLSRYGNLHVIGLNKRKNRFS